MNTAKAVTVAVTVGAIFWLSVIFAVIPTYMCSTTGNHLNMVTHYSVTGGSCSTPILGTPVVLWDLSAIY
jgi:hypothetical protein